SILNHCVWNRKEYMAMASQQPKVFEYKKRRLDGGNEIELIQQIETQRRAMEQYQQYQNAMSAGIQPVVQTATAMQVPTPPVQAEAVMQHERPNPEAVPARDKRDRIFRAVSMPWVEFVLGVAGLLIGGIMYVGMLKKVASIPAAFENERRAVVTQS